MSQNQNPNPVNAEAAEPSAGSSVVPIWMVLIAGCLFIWGALYLDAHAGGYNKDVFEPYSSYAEVEKVQPKDEKAKARAVGKDIFDRVCSLCHGQNGLGKPGQYPPLAGSDWLLGAGPNRIGRVVMFGISGPIRVVANSQTVSLNAAMPQPGDFTDEQIAAVLTYVRQRSDWGNNAPEVTPDQIKAVRASSSAHKGLYSPDDLLKLPEQLPAK